MSIQMPPSQTAMDMAFTALQYLPMPLLVLSSDKTIVLANEALGRLFGINSTLTAPSDTSSIDTHGLTRVDSGPLSATDILYGVSLGSLGIDLLQNGTPIWVTWDEFLESLLSDALAERDTPANLEVPEGESTPKVSAVDTETAANARRPSTPGFSDRAALDRATIHEVVVDVAFSSHRDPRTGMPSAPVDNKRRSATTPHTTQSVHIEASLIISIWFLDGQQHYTLTFTAAHNVKPSQKSSQRSVTKMHRNYMSGMGSGSSSSSGGRRTHHSSHSSSPSSGSVPWLPNAPASNHGGSSGSTLLSKSVRMKDAILHAINMPVYAMWKDESFGVPNKAALKLLGGSSSDGTDTDQREFLSQFKLYTADYSQPLPLEQYPIMVLMRTQKRFTNMRLGMMNLNTGEQLVFDVDGEEIRDSTTGEFLAGLVIFKDVTVYTNAIQAQKALTEKQFEDVTNMIPVMVFTSAPDGFVDYFSQRWYDYTGMTPDECIGYSSWCAPFHEDDITIAGQRWKHSLTTGEEYLTEYRCKSRMGEWRWMLGRALPMRDSKGKIVRWYASFAGPDRFFGPSC